MVLSHTVDPLLALIGTSISYLVSYSKSDCLLASLIMTPVSVKEHTKISKNHYTLKS